MNTHIKRILIVDDEANILKSLQRILEDDFDVTIALGGVAALEILNKTHQPFNLILSDLSMQEVNGIDIYRYVASHFPALKAQIIFMTGSAYTPDLKEFMSSIDNPCLEKPFKQEDLYQAINDILTK